MATRVRNLTGVLAEGVRRLGHRVVNEVFFDTLTIEPAGVSARRIVERARERGINLRESAGHVGVSLDETVGPQDLDDLFAAFSGDLAPAALVHRAEVTLASAEGRRRVTLDALYRNDGMDHLALGDGELLVALHLPKESAGIPSGYRKSRIRGSIDFPLAGVAAALRMEGGRVASLDIALTAVNPYPHRVVKTESFVGGPLGDDALDTLRDTVRTQAKPMRTTTVQPWYRRRVVGAMARRLVSDLAGGDA